MQRSAIRQQIRNLLIVIFSGMACACALAAFMLYYYGPSGQYLVSNTLLSPDVMAMLSYMDTNAKTGGSTRFVFNGIEYAYYDTMSREWRKVPATQEAYERFYNLVASDKSLAEVPEDIISLFNRGHPASLVLTVRTESKAEWQEVTKVFQEVQFAGEGNYFRIELRSQSSSTGKWAYFYRPQIYQEAAKIFL